MALGGAFIGLRYSTGLKLNHDLGVGVRVASKQQRKGAKRIGSTVLEARLALLGFPVGIMLVVAGIQAYIFGFSEEVEAGQYIAAGPLMWAAAWKYSRRSSRVALNEHGAIVRIHKWGFLGGKPMIAEQPRMVAVGTNHRNKRFDVFLWSAGDEARMLSNVRRRTVLKLHKKSEKIREIELIWVDSPYPDPKWIRRGKYLIGALLVLAWAVIVMTNQTAFLEGLEDRIDLEAGDDSDEPTADVEVPDWVILWFPTIVIGWFALTISWNTLRGLFKEEENADLRRMASREAARGDTGPKLRSGMAWDDF